MAEVRATVPRNTEAMGSIYGPPQDSSVQWLRQYLPSAAGDFLAQREQEALRPVSGREIAGQLIQSGMDVLPATFGGPMAMTANKPMLAAAQKMATSGAPREAIWDKTGWFQGADSKWRFEIPDDAAKLHLKDAGYFGITEKNGPLGTAMSHEPLFSAYPEFRNIDASISSHPQPDPTAPPGLGEWKNRGSFQTSTINGHPVGEGSLSAAGNSETSALSLSLHELQHAIQNREGFQRGGSPRGIPRELIDQERARIVARAAEEKPSWTKVGNSVPDAPDWSIANDLYQRIPGEVEARAVQNRMNLTPEQRRARYPWLDYDVPVEQQIVR